MNGRHRLRAALARVRHGHAISKWIRTRSAVSVNLWVESQMTATLSLWRPIVGFTFFMAVGRYDQRKDFEGRGGNCRRASTSVQIFLPDSEGENVGRLLPQHLD
jgi:hypothetical protein